MSGAAEGPTHALRWPAPWTGDLPATTAVVQALTLRPESASSQGAGSEPDLRLSHEVVATPVGSGLITHNRYITRDGVTAEQKARLVAEITTTLQRVLGKRPEHTHIVIDEVDPENWGFGGVLTTVYRAEHGPG